MQALQLTPDLQVSVVQYDTHQEQAFFYKGVQIKKFVYRPATYKHRSPHSVQCDSPEGDCIVCKQMLTVRDPIEVQIDSYISKLFQVRDREISIGKMFGKLTLWIQGYKIFEWAQYNWKWSSNQATNRGVTIKIFTDCLEIESKELIVFRKDHPFQKQILDQLGRHQPFSEAPVWF